jgi:hypothetical protein
VERIGEKIGIIVFKVLSPLMIGGLRNYRPVKAADIAVNKLKYALKNEKGKQVILHNQW